MQQNARVGGEAPVVVLATAIDALERLFVEQRAEAVFMGNFLHQPHQYHVVVYGQVAFLKNGSQLKLVGCHLVMAGLAGYAQLKSLCFKVFHKGLYTLGDGAKIVVVHLLVLGRVMAHQGASGQHEVGSGHIEIFVYKEIFLLPAEVGLYFLHVGIEKPSHLEGC